MVSVAGPELSVVDNEAAEGAERAPAHAEAGEPKASGPRRGRLLGVIAGLVILALGILAGQQYRRAGFLASRVDSLQAELVQVEGQLVAHRNHLAAVRRGFSDLTSVVGRLRTVVEAEPAAAGASSPTVERRPPEASPATP
ncbi:MAG: hypothetical protein OSB70_09780 [Myxococcota bacterium]|jgi:hypothetical protein|nr:hypothetical protein [Myxococcota bacterium]